MTSNARNAEKINEEASKSVLLGKGCLTVEMTMQNEFRHFLCIGNGKKGRFGIAQLVLGGWKSIMFILVVQRPLTIEVQYREPGN